MATESPTARACAAALAGAAAVVFTLVAGYDSDVVWGTALGAVGLILTIAQQTYVIPLWAELRIELATALATLRGMRSRSPESSSSLASRRGTHRVLRIADSRCTSSSW